jgi:hypothetical protein
MMETRTLCYICGKVASNTCKLCGKHICPEHYDSATGLCTSHLRPKKQEIKR